MRLFSFGCAGLISAGIALSPTLLASPMKGYFGSSGIEVQPQKWSSSLVERALGKPLVIYVHPTIEGLAVSHHLHWAGKQDRGNLERECERAEKFLMRAQRGKKVRRKLSKGGELSSCRLTVLGKRGWESERVLYIVPKGRLVAHHSFHFDIPARHQAVAKEAVDRFLRTHIKPERGH